MGFSFNFLGEKFWVLILIVVNVVSIEIISMDRDELLLMSTHPSFHVSGLKDVYRGFSGKDPFFLSSEQVLLRVLYVQLTGPDFSLWISISLIDKLDWLILFSLLLVG